jgi:hypothetical protein
MAWILLTALLILILPTVNTLREVYGQRKVLKDDWKPDHLPQLRRRAGPQIRNRIVREWLRLLTHAVAGSAIIVAWTPLVDWYGLEFVVRTRTVALFIIMGLLSLKSIMASINSGATREIQEVERLKANGK